MDPQERQANHGAGGLLVEQAGGAAGRAGVQAGDVLLAVNGTPVKDARELARTIAMLAPDSTVKLDVLRKSARLAPIILPVESPV